MFNVLLILSFVTFCLSINCHSATSCRECLEMGCGADGGGWCSNSKVCTERFGLCAGKMVRNDFNCPKQPATQYDEKFTRHVIYPLIGATKGKTNEEIQLCADSSEYEFQLQKRIDVSCPDIYHDIRCTADVYTSVKNNAIVIVPHGSTGEHQELNVAFYLYVSPLTTRYLNFTVLAYFAKAFESLWAGGLQLQVDIALRKLPTAKVYVVGHSLGGAIASIAAATLVANGTVPSSRIETLTFGQPKVGDRTFAETYERLIPHHWRIINQGDVLPLEPTYVIDDDEDVKILHFRHEVFYNTSMVPGAPYQVCNQPESPECRGRSRWRNEMLYHNTYFNVNLSQWYKNGCKY